MRSLRSDFLSPPNALILSNTVSLLVDVLEKALEVWDLQVIPLNDLVAEPAQIDPELENAFICHLRTIGFWLSPEDADRITKSCNSASRSSPGHGQPEILSDNEDDDLKAAIASSLINSLQEIKIEASITENEN
ncbi:unnamed protein product [Fraxinus pennsylvanica]|uniref:Uncharacterized protein n=1 Tax=Fraxinus pennsylvanica TaxID=56036 RepID=A0AAD2A0B0_9LAMI|nr:unnamed protein product [Fraxinus pennsylvanica]